MTVSGSLNPDFYGHNLNLTDNARQTVGETTSSMTVAGSLNPEHKETHYYDPKNISRQTIKQTTSLSKYISNALTAEELTMLEIMIMLKLLLKKQLLVLMNKQI